LKLFIIFQKIIFGSDRRVIGCKKKTIGYMNYLPCLVLL